MSRPRSSENYDVFALPTQPFQVPASAIQNMLRPSFKINCSPVQSSPRSLWLCGASSFDEDEHNTSNSLLLACAHALVAPALLSVLTEPDELSVAVSCRFALDIWTVMQHEDPSADQEPVAGSDSQVLLSLDAPCELVRLQGPDFSTGGLS